jgi:hypothetical protein
VVPGVPRRTRLTLPDVVSEQAEVADEATRGAWVAGPPMPEMQGTQRRTVPHSIRPRGLAGARGSAATRPARADLWRTGLAELERRGAAIAVVPFSGRAGRSGHTDRIVLSRIGGDQLVDIERWTGRDELCYALEAPVWDRFGSFAGQPQISGTVIWTAADRRVVVEGRRGVERFEERV